MNLTLLAPAALFAAISLAVVYALHFRRQSPPLRVFPTLRFWTQTESLEEERRSYRFPPITLPLVLQLLLALLITLALARPALGGGFSILSNRTTPEHHIVVLDGSTSMLAYTPGESRTRWEVARQQASDLVDRWQEGDVVTVIVLGTTIETRSVANNEQKQHVRSWLRSAPLPGGRADVNAALRLAGDLELPNRINRISLLSDGAVQVDPAIVATVPMPITFVDIGNGNIVNNVALSGVTAKAVGESGNQFAISFTISNFANTEMDIPWIVEGDDVEVASNTVFLDSGESTQITVNLPVATGTVRATLAVQDGLAADNVANLSLGEERVGTIHILMISAAPSPLLRALQVLPNADVDLQPSITPGLKELSQSYDLVVFEGTTPSADDMPATPMLFVQPGPLNGLFAITGALTSPTLGSVDSSDPVLSSVDLSGVSFGSLPVYTPTEHDRVLVSVTEGSVSAPLLWTGTVGSSRYVSLALDLTSTNLTQRVSFPILVSNVVDSLVASSIPVSVPLGDPLQLPVGEDIAQVKITLPNRIERMLTPAEGADSVLFSATGMAGTYSVAWIRADGTFADTGKFEVNAGDARESNLRPVDNLAEVLRGTGNGSASGAEATSQRNELWLALALFALIVLIIEWWLDLRTPRRSALQLGRSPT